MSGLPAIIDPNITVELPIAIAVSALASRTFPASHEVFEHSMHCLLQGMQMLPLL
jgi:hypothetical protein